MTPWFKGLFAAMAVAALAACGFEDDEPVAPPTLAEVAQANGLNALTAAATKAGLVDVLADPDADLTVFAPTDDTFNALAIRLGFADATAMVDALPQSALASIVSYHVLPGRKTAAELSAGDPKQATAYTFDAAPATVTIGTVGGITVTDAVLTAAHVTTADVAASNGVAHVIDKVLVPPGVLTIVQMAQANPAFSTLVDAVVAANLQGALGGAGPFTVFAPTNDAFAAIASTVAGLTPSQLQTVLTYHVLGSQVLSSEIPFGTPVTTLADQDIAITAEPLAVADTTATPAPILATDVRASNGVIHVIGKVLIPAL